MADPAEQLTPRTHSLRVGGLALAGTGSCLMWTVILIPIAVPMALIGIIMFVVSFFQGKEVITCPACKHAVQIEPTVTVLVCPACRLPIRREDGGWVRV